MALTTHSAWEVLCVAPSSVAQRVIETVAATQDERIRTLTVVEGTSRASMVGHAARAARGEQLVLLDAPSVPLHEDWLDALLGLSTQDGVAAAGAKVLRPDGTIEHAGVVIGEGLPLAAYRGVRGDYVGYLGTLAVPANYAAVAGALATQRELFLSLGGFSSDHSPIAEADYCLRARAQGLRTVFAPDAELRLLDAPDRRAISLAELAAFKKRWLAHLPRDPYYHPHFWQQRAAFPGPRPGAAPSDESHDLVLPELPSSNS